MKKEDELKLLQDAWIKLWHTYITWFTWHFAIHVTILTGFVYGSGIVPVLQHHSKLVLSAILGFALLGSGAPIAMLWYQCQVQARVRELDAGISWTIFGGALARYAGIATLLTNGLLLGVWAYLLWKWPLA